MSTFHFMFLGLGIEALTACQSARYCTCPATCNVGNRDARIKGSGVYLSPWHSSICGMRLFACDAFLSRGKVGVPQRPCDGGCLEEVGSLRELMPSSGLSICVHHSNFCMAAHECSLFFFASCGCSTLVLWSSHVITSETWLFKLMSLNPVIDGC